MAKIVHASPEKTYQKLLDLCVELNLDFYRISQTGAMVYRSDHTRRDTEFAIERVRREKTRNKKIRRIAERFPHDWPLVEQAAYLLRAFSGLQIFPDANHRTGLAIMREHLHTHWQHFDLNGPALSEFIEGLRDHRSRYCTRCNAGELRDRNVPFLHIAEVVQQNTRPFTRGERLGTFVQRIPGFSGVPGKPPLIVGYAGTDNR